MPNAMILNSENNFLNFTQWSVDQNLCFPVSFTYTSPAKVFQILDFLLPSASSSVSLTPKGILSFAPFKVRPLKFQLQDQANRHQTCVRCLLLWSKCVLLLLNPLCVLPFVYLIHVDVIYEFCLLKLSSG